MRGVHIYNKKVRRLPLTGSVPFVDTGFDIRSTYNFMAAIKIADDSSSDGASGISYQIGRFQGTSSAFNYFITQLVCIGFLRPGHILICDNASIHLTEENRNLSELLWEDYKILVLNLPPYLPELNPIELVFQLLGQHLHHSNARYFSQQMKSEEFFLLKCVEVLEDLTSEDIKKNIQNVDT